MYYDEEEQPYYEPSQADELLMEYQEKMKSALLETVKYQIESYEKENDILKAENQKLKDNEHKVRDRERKLEYEKSDLMRQVKRERLSELMKDFKVIMYQAGSKGVKLPKCDKCNDNREIEFKSPTGKKMKESCKCNINKTVYIPEEYICTEFKVDQDNGNKMLMWYKEHHEKDYDYYGEDSSNYCRVIYSEEMNFEDLECYHTYFKTKEECKKYCKWLDKNRK